MNVEQIAKLRIAVARFGEMDRQRWWNTNGLLTNVGELAISRGFPKTHVFARCRAAFAVASARTHEVFAPPESYTLWSLPAEVEDQIEEAWSSWLERPEKWSIFLGEVDEASNGPVTTALHNLGVVSKKSLLKIETLRRGDDLRSVSIKLDGESIGEAVEILAAAHHCSEPGKLAVPYIRHQDFPK